MSDAPIVFVIDDEAAVRFTLREALESHGLTVRDFSRGTDALREIDTADVVLTDLAMPEVDGLELTRRVRAERPELPVVVLTARGSERAAVDLMKAGAHDYLNKPFDLDHLLWTMDQAIEVSRLRRRVSAAEAAQVLGRAIVGQSPVMRRLLGTTARVAGKDVTVLVRGETGTGKELIAALLHAQSPRASAPMVRFNCAAISADLADAELFGHARGAFTGAHAARSGFVQKAHGGTLVLDEVAELPLEIQAKLLRVLQEGEAQPVGASKVERVDVRVVACTHRDLAAEVKRGRFREDLFYRLNVVELWVPPLRERSEDIPSLARAFAVRYADKFGLEDVRLSNDLLESLTSRSWPGNVRELENTVARLLAFSEGGELGLEALGRQEPVRGDASGAGPLRARVQEFEKQLIAEALEAARGNQSEAARQLSVTRVTLIDKMKRYGLHLARKG